MSESRARKRERITAYIRTFDEEANIADCVRSVLWCDEVLVVDSYSTDRTVEIARELGATVVQRRWEGAGAQLRFALSQVRTEWSLSLDADERITPELRRTIEAMLANPDERIMGYRLGRVTWHLGKYFDRGTLFRNASRLARTGHCEWTGDDPHNHLTVHGKTAVLRGGYFLHLRNRDLAGQSSIYNRYSSEKAEAMWDRGVRSGVGSILLRPLGRFLRSYFLRQGFRMGVAGLVSAMEEAAYDFYKYAKLWEKGLAKSPPAGGRGGEEESTATSAAHRPDAKLTMP